MFEKWKKLRKESHLCNVEELELKYKLAKRITKIMFIPVICLAGLIFYFFYAYPNELVGAIAGIILFFIYSLWGIKLMIANLQDRFLQLFLYLKMLICLVIQ